MRRLRTALLIISLLLIGILTIVYVRFGGGRTYPDLSGKPVLTAGALETVLAYAEPIGNVAASTDTGRPTRVFFTVHPESRPEGAKLLEVVNGKGVPYPSAAAQALFNTPLGVYTDQQHRLWVIDHGNHGTTTVTLTAFDLTNNRVAHQYTFPREVAELGSFFNDLSVSPDGRYVYIADVSFWRKQPSIAVYDTQTGRSASRLDNHPSVASQGYVPVNPIKKMRFFGGLVDLMPGVDGLDASPDGKYVYYAAMSHDGLYRVPVAALTNFSLSNEVVGEQVQLVSKKPLSDGIRVDSRGNTLITDVEHSGVAIIAPDGRSQTLLKDPRIRWADGLSFGGDGYTYLADSDIPDQMLQSKAHITSHKPYYIYRFRY
ncbi:L-dopachrome tautomerase-related protein [Fibrella aquatilis]|uniref:Gluconolactonase n=1 Tax=Fibrella aquatilis TaxID=2817059 RepID=A0A939G4K8_9BACT|nr:L-dopachrome tautomerase-related protein [Fibrella aquatilis]MBO0931999.1 hypothetical protein [Fibrella aquatilis]